MSPVLFALVDLVLSASWKEARLAARVRREYGLGWLVINSGIYAEQMRQHVGWWRSTWVTP